MSSLFRKEPPEANKRMKTDRRYNASSWSKHGRNRIASWPLAALVSRHKM